MNLFALHPGCHLGATLSSQKAKQNSCTRTCSCTPVHTQRPDPCQGPCSGGVRSIIFHPLALIVTSPFLLLCLDNPAHRLCVTGWRAAQLGGAAFSNTSWGVCRHSVSIRSQSATAGKETRDPYLPLLQAGNWGPGLPCN